MPRPPFLPLLSLLAAAVLLAGPADALPQAPDSTAATPRAGGLAIVPALFYSPETKLGAGAVLIRTLRPADDPQARPSTVALGVLGTQENQWTAFLSPDFYLGRQAWRVYGLASWSRYPSKFWGLGPGAPEAAEEDYTPRNLVLAGTAQRRLGGGLWLGAGLEFADGRLAAVEAGGLLDGTGLPGSEPGSILGATLLVDADTRDDVFAPERGHLRQVAVTLFGRVLGADHAFTRTRLDLRQYVPLGGRGTLALQALGVTTTAAPPFQTLPALGGQSVLRGYLEGRWRDRCLTVVQAELRRPLSGRFGWALFVGAGAVAPSPGSLALADAHVGYGLGARYRLLRDERLNLRADFGFGDEGSGFYFGAQEAF